ncbi:TRAP transporter small permease subunit [Marinibaculum pumilum]|uniref:TRAP transporter small permease protein n=1 Tax=Marinibaculum pumilum TaxID=1766165 RepID=A0ABV7L3Z0_9PROT
MLDRVVRALVEPASIVGGIALMLLALVVTADVVARAAGFALVGAAEAGGVLLALLVFLVIAYTQRQRGHVAIEALVVMLPSVVRRWADVISLALCLGFTVLLAVTTIGAAWHSYQSMEFQVGTLPFPIWPVRAVIALGFVLFGLQLLVHLLAALGAAIRPAGRGEAA